VEWVVLQIRFVQKKIKKSYSCFEFMVNEYNTNYFQYKTIYSPDERGFMRSSRSYFRAMSIPIDIASLHSKDVLMF